MPIKRAVLVSAISALLVGCAGLEHAYSQPQNESAFSQRSPEERARLAAFLNLELYVYETVVASPELARAQFNAHLDYQVELEKRGILYGAGPLYEADAGRPSAGLVIIRANSMEEARAIADADPMHSTGARTYTMRRWKLNEGALNVTLNFSDQSASIE